MPPTRMVCHGTSENVMADLEGNPHIIREPPKYIYIYITGNTSGKWGKIGGIS